MVPLGIVTSFLWISILNAIPMQIKEFLNTVFFMVADHFLNLTNSEWKLGRWQGVPIAAR